MGSERISKTQTVDSDHDEYSSSISVDSRACSSVVGVIGGEQAKVRVQVCVCFLFSLDPISFAKPLFHAQ